MGRTLSIVFLATIAIVALFQSSLAQRDYIVGDALGWVIPPGPSVYTTWASNKTFRVGDTLVFNFVNGAHDVTKVTRSNYDSCNGRNSLLMISNGPANVTLNETGSHYFICGFSGHCGAGQKLAINVSAASSTSSPAPQPSTAAHQPSSPPTSVPSAASPAPQVGSPSPVSGVPTRSPSPSSSSPSSPPSTATPPSSSSPSPSTATPPSSTDSPPSPINPSSPSPDGEPDNDNATPPTPGSNSATSLGVAILSTTFLPFILAFFM